MKKIYEAPTFELIHIASADIITVSTIDAHEDTFGAEIMDIVIG